MTRLEAIRARLHLVNEMRHTTRAEYREFRDHAPADLALLVEVVEDLMAIVKDYSCGGCSSEAHESPCYGYRICAALESAKQKLGHAPGEG